MPNKVVSTMTPIRRLGSRNTKRRAFTAYALPSTSAKTFGDIARETAPMLRALIEHTRERQQNQHKTSLASQGLNESTQTREAERN